MTGFSFSTLATVLAAIAVTFFAWFSVHESMHARNLNAFGNIAADSESALRHRMENYEIALEAGAGYHTADDWVTAEDWRVFTEALRIDETLPGINGLGFIEPIARDELDLFEARKAAAGLFDLSIHPETSSDELFVITLIEPLAQNSAAIGLDIAFEKNRRAAAIAARDTGRPTITRRIFLVQDDVKRAGFLILRPLYHYGALLESEAARRAAHRGWIYAPFVGQNLLEDLTPSQDRSLTLSVYDGRIVDPDLEIYASPGREAAKTPPAFTITKTVPVLNHEWTIVWQSTPAFETSVRRHEAEIVLGSGLGLTVLLGALLMSLSHRETSVREQVVAQTSLLAAREKAYAAIFDTAAAAILLLDDRGRVLTTNAVAREYFGEVNGTAVTAILGDLDLDHLRAPGRPSDRRHRSSLAARGLGRKEILLELESNRWFTSEGEERFTLVLLDVTEETRIAADLADNELRLGFILNGTGVGVFDLDLGKDTLTVSPTWQDMFGLDHRQSTLPRSEWLDRIDPGDVRQVLDRDAACIAGSSEHSLTEHRIRRVDGTAIWVRSSAFVSKRDAEGRALRMTGTLVDIHEQKLTLEALRLSEARFRSAMENAPVGTALVTATGDIIDANDALADFLGCEKADLAGLPLRSLIDHDGPEDGADLPSFDAISQTDIPFRRKDGAIVWGLLTASAVAAGDRHKSYAIVQILNVDERRKIDRMKRDFIATVSHELRTPLTSVRSSLGMMRISIGEDIPEGTDRLITLAQNNCDRLTVLVNDILDFEKLVSGKMEIERDVFDAAALVSGIVSDAHAYSAARSIEIAFRHDGAPGAISANRDRIAQVLNNLISNAVKFSPKGKPVVVEVTARDGRVKVSVTDRGPGVPADFQPRIFSRFAQANSSNTRHPGGTGLGLAISRELIETMGGEIGFVSTEGRGSTFWFSFPSAA